MPRPTLNSADDSLRTFISISGPVHLQVESVRAIEREGIDGVAHLKLGKKAPVSQLTAMVDCTTAQLENLQDELAGYRGQAVTYVDKAGVSRALFCESSQEVSVAPVGKTVGGEQATPDWLVTWRFGLRATEI